MKNIKYKFTENEGIDWANITLDEIGHRILNYDGYEYEVRFNELNKTWTLFASNASRNSGNSNSKFTEIWKHKSDYENECDAEGEILTSVGLDFVRGGEWKNVGNQVSAMTIKEYNER
jgi:hypothetical protein